MSALERVRLAGLEPPPGMAFPRSWTPLSFSRLILKMGSQPHRTILPGRLCKL